MGKIKDEDLRLNIIVNGNEALKKIAELKAMVSGFKDKMSELNQDKKILSKSKDPVDLARLKQVKKEIDDITQSLKSSTQKLADVRKGMKLSETPIPKLGARIRKLMTEMRHLEF